jgi:D-proline reductase (dithiol) PrdB
MHVRTERSVGRIDEFELPVRLFLRAYRWRRIDPIPWAPLRRPLSESRLALVSSAGLVRPGQEPFDDSLRGGDTTWRTLPDDVDLRTLVDCHRSDAFDHSAMMRDLNLVFPVDRVRELADRGRIGAVNFRHASLMGSITAPGRLIRDTAPAVADTFAADGVDAALLVPV